MFKRLVSYVMLGALATAAMAEEIETFTEVPAVQNFIAQMVSEHGFDKNHLSQWFAAAQFHPGIIEAISRPAESKPWYQYRPIFLTRDRMDGGLKFWDEHQDILEQAEAQYGVPPQVITAIIGVETRYGRHKGRYPVIDALSTLAFAYPPRSDFFRSELEHFLLMTREEKMDPLSLTGSYAGAMGMPQFISSSFRAYAVDFDGDGQRNLWTNTADAIGSVGNYLHRHGWRAGEPVATRVGVSGLKYQDLLNKGLKPRWSVEQLQLAGVKLPPATPGDLEGILLELDSGDGPEYWVGWHNFYVISRYNHSALYSLAVYQLSEAMRSSR